MLASTIHPCMCNIIPVPAPPSSYARMRGARSGTAATPPIFMEPPSQSGALPGIDKQHGYYVVSLPPLLPSCSISTAAVQSTVLKLRTRLQADTPAQQPRRQTGSGAQTHQPARAGRRAVKPAEGNGRPRCVRPPPLPPRRAAHCRRVPAAAVAATSFRRVRRHRRCCASMRPAPEDTLWRNEQEGALARQAAG